ncbi:MAG: collagen-like protein, partial [bacterium]|nr:collagen-like protein [bacterium]
KGDTGPQSEKGKAGPQDVKGDTGPRGKKGDTGPQGKNGERGDTGPQGAKGDTGPHGMKGDTGPQGKRGDTGPQGAKGDTGPHGMKGDTGPQGEKGDKGLLGEKGANGHVGDVGPVGPQGGQGRQGEKGSKGDPGANGKSSLEKRDYLQIVLLCLGVSIVTSGVVSRYTANSSAERARVAMEERITRLPRPVAPRYPLTQSTQVQVAPSAEPAPVPDLTNRQIQVVVSREGSKSHGTLTCYWSEDWENDPVDCAGLTVPEGTVRGGDHNGKTCYDVTKCQLKQ